MSILNTITLISYLALVTDVLFQIGKVYKTKSSKDLSLLGMSIRYVAILIIFIKFFSLSDLPLILGQGLIGAAFTAYFILAVYYRRGHQVKQDN